MSSPVWRHSRCLSGGATSVMARVPGSSHRYLGGPGLGAQGPCLAPQPRWRVLRSGFL